MRIIVPRAGMGKRMRPHTLTTPKPLIKVGGKSIVHWLIKDIAEELHAIGVHKVYADNEPRTIKELRNRGIRIKPAKKGKDSIRQGLGFIRTHQIFIHEEALETIKEFREYKYKKSNYFKQIPRIKNIFKLLL